MRRRERTLVKQPGSVRKTASNIALAASDQYATFVAALDPECPVSRKCIEVLARETITRANGKKRAQRAAYTAARRVEDAAAAAVPRPRQQPVSRAWMESSSTARLGARSRQDAEEMAQYDAILAEAQRRVTSPLPGASGLDANTLDYETRTETRQSPPAQSFDEILAQLNHEVEARTGSSSAPHHSPFVNPRDLVRPSTSGRRSTRRPRQPPFQDSAPLDYDSVDDDEEVEALEAPQGYRHSESRAAAVERELREYRQWSRGAHSSDSDETIIVDGRGPPGWRDAERADRLDANSLYGSIPSSSSAATTRRRIVERLAERRREREAQHGLPWPSVETDQDADARVEAIRWPSGRPLPSVAHRDPSAPGSSLGLSTGQSLPIVLGNDLSNASGAEAAHTSTAATSSAQSTDTPQPQRQGSLRRNFSIRRSGYHASPGASESSPPRSTSAINAASSGNTALLSSSQTGAHPSSTFGQSGSYGDLFNPMHEMYGSDGHSELSTAALANNVAAIRSLEFGAHSRSARAADRAAREARE